ncbi:radical SAM protein [bacterium]|nr:radical SAM protein [bacterium]
MPTNLNANYSEQDVSQFPHVNLRNDPSYNWRELKYYCKCDCMTPHTIPKDIPALFKPAVAYLELTQHCSNQCTGCPFQKPDFSKDCNPFLDFSAWKYIINKLSSSVQRVQLTGGEPTLHPDFYKITEYLNQKRISFIVFTNGRWDKPDTLLRHLKNLQYFDGFLISLHGPNAETHELFTQAPGSYRETLKNIKLAVENKISTAASTVLFLQNINSLLETYQVSKAIGMSHLVFNRYIGLAPENIRLTNQQLISAIYIIENAISFGAAVRFGNCIPQCFSKSSSSGCMAGTAFMSVDVHGNVKPCNHSALSCGNLLKNSLLETWESEEMNFWRQLLPNQCQSCSEFSNCHGGCRAEALRVPTGLDPLILNPVH